VFCRRSFRHASWVVAATVLQCAFRVQATLAARPVRPVATTEQSALQGRGTRQNLRGSSARCRVASPGRQRQQAAQNFDFMVDPLVFYRAIIAASLFRNHVSQAAYQIGTL